MEKRQRLGPPQCRGTKRWQGKGQGGRPEELSRRQQGGAGEGVVAGRRHMGVPAEVKDLAPQPSCPTVPSTLFPGPCPWLPRPPCGVGASTQQPCLASPSAFICVNPKSPQKPQSAQTPRRTTRKFSPLGQCPWATVMGRTAKPRWRQKPEETSAKMSGWARSLAVAYTSF